eukprot:scaffold29450_cov51-Phaeocystis_antarctica.AAC.1
MPAVQGAPQLEAPHPRARRPQPVPGQGLCLSSARSAQWLRALAQPEVRHLVPAEVRRRSACRSAAAHSRQVCSARLG